jgi:protein SCO1
VPVRRLVIFSGLLLAVCFASGVVALGRRQPSAVAPALLTSVAFRDQNDAKLTGAALGAELLLLNFIFTRCGSVCPTQTRELSRMVAALPADLRPQLRLLSVSLEPEHDGPAQLSAFARAHGAEMSTWTFAAAAPDETQRLLARLRPTDAATGAEPPAAHGADLYLFDRHGRLVQRFGGSPLDRARLVRDLTSLCRSQGSCK